MSRATLRYRLEISMYPGKKMRWVGLLVAYVKDSQINTGSVRQLKVNETQGTTVTGTGAIWTSVAATLPKSIDPRPVDPLRPMNI